MEDKGQSKKRFRGTPLFLCLLVLLAIATYILLAEHRAHLIGALPLIGLLLLCPLMHVLMHRGHRHRHDRPKGPEDSDRDKETQ